MRNNDDHKLTKALAHTLILLSLSWCWQSFAIDVIQKLARDTNQLDPANILHLNDEEQPTGPALQELNDADREILQELQTTISELLPANHNPEATAADNSDLNTQMQQVLSSLNDLENYALNTKLEAQKSTAKAKNPPTTSPQKQQANEQEQLYWDKITYQNQPQPQPLTTKLRSKALSHTQQPQPAQQAALPSPAPSTTPFDAAWQLKAAHSKFAHFAEDAKLNQQLAHKLRAKLVELQQHNPSEYLKSHLKELEHNLARD